MFRAETQKMIIIFYMKIFILTAIKIQYIAYMISNLDCALNRDQKQTNVIFMDFAKAFDKVPHKRLLYKLEYYGIRGSTHKWISSWLSGRSQKVVLDDEASDPVPVLSGVPQGSGL